MTGLEEARSRIRRLHRAPEPEVVASLLSHVRLDPNARRRVEERGRAMLHSLRASHASGWVNEFLQEYRLNSVEGTALLALAEAFLRVPDPETADALIADKLGSANWRAHTGKSHSALVNSATWGLVIGRALLGESDQASVLKRLIARAGEPFVRQAIGAAMRMMGETFVMGRTIEEAVTRMNLPAHVGFTASFDMLGEAARTFPDAEHYAEAYARAIRVLGQEGRTQHSISVKLSALHPRYEVAQQQRCLPALIERIEALCMLAAKASIGITIDAEESERLEMNLDLIDTVARLKSLRDWDGLGMAVQAYGKRARPIIDWVQALGEATDRRITVRLVKGAYWDSEIKRAQEAGLPDYPLFTRKAATDVCYLACGRAMFSASRIRPAFATHNALTVATLLEWAGPSRDFEFQRLHGMGEGLYEPLVREEGYACRIYAPVGGHRDLLAYLVRRLLENGANTSFVHQLVDEHLSDSQILADPVAKIEAAGGAPHPAIPLPRDLYAPDRRNSQGLDLNDRLELDRVRGAVARAPNERTKRGGVRAAQAALGRALTGFPAWSQRSLEDRATIIEQLGDLLERERDSLMALAVQEGRKTIPDALAEVREAADYCRYYASQARRYLQPVELPGPTGERNVLRMEGRGAWICIAPWNFPLAIFLGQVTAALVAGNSVVAKPAPQTPRVAALAVELAHRAGVPKNALMLAVGGPDVGAALVDDPRIAGVAFTGSTATGKVIARSLLNPDDRPIVPLIAETGGVNAMIVDSTALPEQVVVDVITSAFRSAGQRCSAMRLLLLQEEIAERTLAMLAGAMDTLVVGDPADPATDVGPVIDQGAYDRLMHYRGEVQSRWLKTIPVPAKGWFVPPTLIRVDAVEALRCEWFGPLLHVGTWPAGSLAETVERVNASGYGLTMGLHSRIARAAETVEDHAHVGNLYVNRSMIGAVVGVQPFGGEGLSGTGPKAGGPHYLPRFCVERVTSTDTTSTGGNATLLSLDDIGL
jgi:RHH-type proline utilization regulon transcriptional repressor/proline dehydrogenase/delta 1-pyrroline-5-carboxylate dehydrogenase